MQKVNSQEKALMLGKTECKRRRGQQRMRWLESITDSTHMNLSELRKIVDREAWWAADHGVAKSQLFASGGQSIRASASASVLPVNIQGWYPLGLTGLFSLLFKGLSEVFSTPFKSINSSVLSLLNGPTLTSIHDYWKNHSFYYLDLCQQSDVSAS